MTIGHTTGWKRKSKLPTQSVPNPKGQINRACTVASSSHSLEHVQYVVTLRSGKQYDNNVTDQSSLQENAEQVKRAWKEVTKEKMLYPKQEIRKYVPKALFAKRL